MSWGSSPVHLVPYGHHKAKVDLGYLQSLDTGRWAS